MLASILRRPFYHFLFLLTASGLIGCSRTAVAVTGDKSASASIQVTVAAPQKRTIHWTVEQPGTIMAFETTPIVAKLPGYISRVLVDMGDPIVGPEFNSLGVETKPGTLLAELSIPELEEERIQKEAQAAQARVEIEVAKKNLLVAQANIRTAETAVEEAETTLKRTEANVKRWKSETARSDEMVAKRVMDRQTAEETRNQAAAAESEHDEAKARIVSAQAKLSESRAKEQQSKSEVSAAEARSTAAAADLRRVTALKQYTHITAPYTGIVTSRIIHTQHFVQMNSAQPLFMVARLDPIRIFVDVPEVAANRISNGSPGRVKIPSLQNAEISGSVTRTSWALNPDMRTLRIEIDLPNPNGRIKPGTFTTVLLPIEDKDVWTIPVAATFMLDEYFFCYIVEKGLVRKMRVNLGQREGDFVEILSMTDKDARMPWQPIRGDEQIVTKYEGPIAHGEKAEVK